MQSGWYSQHLAQNGHLINETPNNLPRLFVGKKTIRGQAASAVPALSRGGCRNSPSQSLQRLAAISAAGSFSLAALEETWISRCLASISWEDAGPGNLWFEHQLRDQMKWLLAVNMLPGPLTMFSWAKWLILSWLLSLLSPDHIHLVKGVEFPGPGWLFFSCAERQSTSGTGWGGGERSSPGSSASYRWRIWGLAAANTWWSPESSFKSPTPHYTAFPAAGQFPLQPGLGQPGH